jgi:hypothetical protein
MQRSRPPGTPGRTASGVSNVAFQFMEAGDDRDEGDWVPVVLFARAFFPAGLDLLAVDLNVPGPGLPDGDGNR